jgi:hypothetical protein
VTASLARPQTGIRRTEVPCFHSFRWPGFLDYRASFGAAPDLMQRSAQLTSFFLPGHEMQQTKNKIAAFRLFDYADQALHFPTDRVLH